MGSLAQLELVGDAAQRRRERRAPEVAPERIRVLRRARLGWGGVRVFEVRIVDLYARMLVFVLSSCDPGVWEYRS